MKYSVLLKKLAVSLMALSLLTGCGQGGEAPQESGAEQEQQEEQQEQPQEAETQPAPLESGEGEDLQAGGWMESLYAVIPGVFDDDVTQVSYSGPVSGSLEGDDLEYLVRENDEGDVRIDIPGLPAGTYSLSVTADGKEYKKEGIEVESYDRSGYAHFGYDSGVGAYKDDGTLKDNAIVLYVTDDNKNDVEVTCGDVTVKGIGNILNSGGMAVPPKDEDVSGDSVSADTTPRTSKGGIANTNQGIIKLLAEADIPLVVRFVGPVSDCGLYDMGSWDPREEGQIQGLTAFSLEKELTEEQGLEPMFDYGANQGDNGHMARMVSGKNITLEGIGTDALIDGWGFHFIAAGSDKDTDRGESFEVRNLTFMNTAEDAVGLEGNTEKNEEGKDDVNLDFTKGVERCWIHNNRFFCPSLTFCAAAEGDKMEGDGSIDFKKGQYVTFSYNYFEGNHKTSLVGGNDNAIQFNVTYHHNHWYMCGSRAPLSRNANIHMYNNIFDRQTGYCQNTRANAYIFSEYNMFFACRNPRWVVGGAVKSYMDTVAGALIEDQEDALEPAIVDSKDEYVENECQYIAKGIKLDKFDTDSSLSYIPDGNYELDTDFTHLRKVLAARGGTMQEEVIAVDDEPEENYAVFPEFTDVLPLKDVTTVSGDDVPLELSDSVLAFSITSDTALEIGYEDEENAGVLVNAAGEHILTGSGTTPVLPAGDYMIMPANFTPGDYPEGRDLEFGDASISLLRAI